MHRIASLLQKIRQLAENGDSSAIEIDLMMDYTRQLYTELMEARLKTAPNIQDKNIPANTPYIATQVAAPTPPNIPPVYEDKPYTIELNIEPTKVPDTEEEEEEETERDIRSLIAINDKYQIISELFGNDKVVYESMIDMLNTFDTELEALEWLQDHLYFEYSWREDSEALMILHAILHKYYRDN